jgi:hypothetical protein
MIHPTFGWYELEDIMNINVLPQHEEAKKRENKK